MRLRIILSVLAILAIGWYSHQYWQLNNLVNPSATRIVNLPAPSPQFSPTSSTARAGWTTYAHQGMQIQFEYPTSWYIDGENEIYVRIQNYDPKTAPGRSYSPLDDKGKFAFFVGIPTFDHPPLSMVDLKTMLGPAGSDCDGDPTTEGLKVIVSEKSFVVNEYQAFERTSYCSDLPQTTPMPATYVFDSTGKVIMFSQALDYESEQENLNQILQSFRFAE